MEERVIPDYKLLVNTGELYGKDSQLIVRISGQIEEFSKIMKSISEVSSLVENASATSQHAAASSDEILRSVQDTYDTLGKIATSARKQSELAFELYSCVKKIKI